MDMKNVKKITLPNKISVYDTDYRQLDYIHFSGNERIGLGANLLNKYLGFKITFLQDLGENDVSTSVMGYQYVDGSTTKECSISNYAIGSPLTKLVYANNTNFQSTSIKLYDSYSGTEPIHAVTVDNYKGIVKLGNVTKYTHSTSPVGETSTSGTFAIGALYRNGSYREYWKGKVYGLEITAYGSGGTSATGKFYPAQRKSDGVCGLYYINPSTLAGTFHAMVGTDITTGAAGNIVTEEGIFLKYEDIDVKKIENSNGDIVWGSYDAFPYRRLEYIHFNGAEYINDTYNVYSGMKLTLTFKADYAGEMYSGTNYAGGTTSAQYNNTIGTSADGSIAGWFLGAYRSYNTYSGTDKHAVTLDKYNGKVYIDGTQVYSGTAQYGGTTSGGLYYGCRNSGTNEKGLYMHANIYRITITNNGTSTWVRNLIPVQRKSDGVCGLYNVSTGIFYPMEGTTITDGAAGPTLDEYWDLTDPF